MFAFFDHGQYWNESRNRRSSDSSLEDRTRRFRTERLGMKAILPAILVAIAFLLGRLSVGDRQASLGVSEVQPPLPTTATAVVKASTKWPARAALNTTPAETTTAWVDATNRYPLHPKQVADELVNQRAEYTPIFESFGLDKNQIDDLFQAFAEIHELAITAGESRTDLMARRERFNADLRKMLSPESYNAWKEHQGRRPAALEAAEVVSFNTRNGISTPESAIGEMASFISDSNGVTTRPWHGVSDALPEPLHGKDLMVPYLEHKIATLKRLLGEVDGATGATLSLEAKEGLRHYYGARIQSANEMLDFCNRLQP